MTLKEYLSDKKYFMLYYVILMIVISTVVYLNETLQVSINNVIYINIVAMVFTITYLLGDYYRNKKYYQTLNYILENREDDIIYALPEPKTFRQEVTNKLLTHSYKNEQAKLHKLYDEKRDNLEYITSWVHEIKTPIAITRLLIEDSDDQSKEDVLNSLEDEIDKIDRYVEQTLYYSKIDDFSKDYFISEYNVEEIVKSNIAKHAKIFISKKIKIEIKDIDFFVSTDKKWLGFILDQIVSNALKYTNDNGIIKIYVKQNSKGKTLVIEDNGIGIKEEDIDRVFNKGFTGYNGRGLYKSTGMGLYLAKELGQKLGHPISIESSYGEWTKVKIHFPKLTDYFDVIF
ncbi:MAG: sensor histidine kinase [Cellulosilyticaceae bacterium]